MSINIKKPGKNIIAVENVDVICPVCECEFSCDSSDFEKGVIICPNCKREIPYTETETYKERMRFQTKEKKIKEKLKNDIIDTINFKEIVKYKQMSPHPLVRAYTVDELKEMLSNMIDRSIEEKTRIEDLSFIVDYIEDKDNNEIGVDVCYIVTHSSAYIDTNTLELKIY